MTKLAFVDTETTGLDPDLHEIWEVGLITRDTDAPMEEDVERRWLLPVDLGRADPYALKVGRYYDRYTDAAWMEAGSDLRSFSGEFAGLTDGAHLVGAVISFDEERLRKLLRAHGACPDWHYHLVDVEALTAGHIGLDPPWKSDELGSYVGVAKQPDEERHTALGDARWARDVYDAVMRRARIL